MQVVPFTNSLVSVSGTSRKFVLYHFGTISLYQWSRKFLCVSKSTRLEVKTRRHQQEPPCLHTLIHYIYLFFRQLSRQVKLKNAQVAGHIMYWTNLQLVLGWDCSLNMSTDPARLHGWKSMYTIIVYSPCLLAGRKEASCIFRYINVPEST